MSKKNTFILAIVPMLKAIPVGRFPSWLLFYIIVTTWILFSLSITVFPQVRKSRQAEINEAAIRAPVKCQGSPSCGDDLSLDEAKASYSEIERKSSKLETLTDYNVCSSPKTRGSYYYWAPMERFSDGASALATLQDRVRNGQPFKGHVIVESTQSTETERHIALCRVSQVGKAVGPPRECVTVAIVTPTEVWLRGGDRHQTLCYVMATFRNSGAINITFNVSTKTNPLEIAASLSRSLQVDFGLSVEQEIKKDKDGNIRSILISSSSSLRDSRILSQGWRESLDFDLYITPEEKTISIRGTAHALVCRQALGSVVNYTGLNDSQRGRYASALDSGVNSAIKSVCKNYRQQDAKTIVCDQ